jgi:hypothetical protein
MSKVALSVIVACTIVSPQAGHEATQRGIASLMPNMRRGSPGIDGILSVALPYSPLESVPEMQQ